MSRRLALQSLFLSLLFVAAAGCQQSATPPSPTTQSEETPAPPSEPAPCSDCVPVTAENFPRAESDLYFAVSVKQAGGIGKFYHYREAMPIDKQTVIRANRDTLYSAAVFDLDAGPVTITLPDSGKRFLAMQVINEDEYTPLVVYGKGSYTLTKEKVGTRYVLTGIRTLVNPDDASDVDALHKLQDAMQISQKSPGTFEVPKWDPASQKKIREALLVLASTLPDMRHAFGSKSEVDPVRYLIASASAWGGNPDKDAIYLNVTPTKNDGTAKYTLHVAKDVPVDGFWSISLYNAKGYYVQNPYNSYSVNNITEKKDADVRNRAIRRMRWKDSELPPHHEWLELHGPALPPTRRNSLRQVEIPRSANASMRQMKGTKHRKGGLLLEVHLSMPVVC